MAPLPPTSPPPGTPMGACPFDRCMASLRVTFYQVVSLVLVVQIVSPINPLPTIGTLPGERLQWDGASVSMTLMSSIAMHLLSTPILSPTSLTTGCLLILSARRAKVNMNAPFTCRWAILLNYIMNQNGTFTFIT